MRESKIKYGIEIDKLRSGFSLGIFFTVAPIHQFTECYLLIHLGFWYVAIGRFWEYEKVNKKLKEIETNIKKEQDALSDMETLLEGETNESN